VSVFVPPRRPSRELLDDDISSDEAERSLRDIEWVHRRLCGRGLLRRRFAPVLAGLGGGSLRVLDVGCGSGHVARDVAALGTNGAAPRVLGVDLKVAHVRLAPRRRSVAADALRLPFASGSVDVVLSTLFLHHFSPEEVVALLVESARVARRAVVAYDLARHRLGSAIIGALGPLVFESRVSVADGRSSVRHADSPAEALARASPVLPGPPVSSLGPFAWELVWRRG
jgi:SAM-dependent methyltransferase